MDITVLLAILIVAAVLLAGWMWYPTNDNDEDI